MTAARPSRVDGVVDSIFAPVAVARASSAIAEQIRTAILSGRLKAGDRLSPERELAEQFGVSRVTVRDALRSLEAMGLIAVKVGARGGLTQSFRSTLSMHPLRVREGSRAHELTVEEHMHIVEALERRDGGAARHAMADHLLRGTSLEERSAPLLEWWRARDVRGAPQASSRRSK